MRKDRIMDRHDWITTNDLDSHILKQHAHVEGTSAGLVFRLVGDNNIFGPSTGGRDAATGSDNFVAGDGAGISITSGDDNNFIGRGAGGSSTSSSDSNAFGPLAGANWLSASRMNAMGPNAAKGAVGCTAADVNAFGRDAGLSLTTGHDLNLFGHDAGDAITNGTHINLLGRGAGTKITGSDHINGMGSNVLFSLTTGGNNNVFGQAGFQNITTGANCNGIGQSIGAGCTGNSNNILCLGNNAGPLTPGEYSQEIYIDNERTDTPLIHGDTDDKIVTINGTLVVEGDITGSEGSFVRRDGTTPLTANWDVGPFIVRALSFNSDVVTGTPPFVSLSETVCPNVNAHMVDGFHHDQSLLLADSPSFAGFTKIGGATDYMTVAADGEITLAGNARVHQHLELTSAAGKKAGVADPNAALVGEFAVEQFSQAVTQNLYFVMHIPEDMDLSAAVTVKVYWAPTTGAAGDVVWDVDYACVQPENNEVLTAAATALTVTDSTQSLQDELLKTANMSIAGGTFGSDDMVSLHLSRDTGDGADTYGAAASFVYLEFEYVANKLGEAL